MVHPTLLEEFRQMLRGSRFRWLPSACALMPSFARHFVMRDHGDWILASDSLAKMLPAEDGDIVDNLLRSSLDNWTRAQHHEHLRLLAAICYFTAKIMYRQDLDGGLSYPLARWCPHDAWQTKVANDVDRDALILNVLPMMLPDGAAPFAAGESALRYWMKNTRRLDSVGATATNIYEDESRVWPWSWRRDEHGPN